MLRKPLVLRAAIGGAAAWGGLLPLYVLRVLASVAVSGVAGSAWPAVLGCIPWEFWAPFAHGLLLLRRDPLMRTWPFARRPFLLALLLSPLLLAVSLLGVVMLHPAVNGSLEASLAVMFALAPPLGVIGLVGFLFFSLPTALAGFGAAFLGDLIYVRSAEPALIALDMERHERRVRAGDAAGLGRLAAETAAARRRCLAALAALPGPTGTRMRRQLLLAEARLLAFAELLGERLEPGELTYQRYLESARQVFLGILDSLERLADGRRGGHLAPDADARLAQNEGALAKLTEATEAVRAMHTRRGQAQIPLPAAVEDLGDLAKRTALYARE